MLHANFLGYRLAAQGSTHSQLIKAIEDVELVPEVSVVVRACTWPSRHCATFFHSPGTTWRRISGAARLRSSDYHGRAGAFVSTCSEAGSKYLKITREFPEEMVNDGNILKMQHALNSIGECLPCLGMLLASSQPAVIVWNASSEMNREGRD